MASIIKNSSGNWRVQIESRGKREYKTFKLKTHAQQWATQREGELQRGLLVTVDDAQKTSLSAVIKPYREKILPRLKSPSFKYMLDLLEREFGNVRLISLQTKDVADFRDRRLKDGKAPATVMKELNLFRTVIDYAITERSIYLPANPARAVKNPEVNNARDRILTPAEQKKLFKAFRHPMLPHITTFALESACRLGELLKIRWEFVDFRNRTLYIPKGITKKEVARTVPLSTAAVNTLKKTPRKRGEGRIFYCWAKSDSFSKLFRRAVGAAKIKYVRFHDLRHMATSRLAKKIPNVIELSMVTGHTDLKMLKRYYHASAKELAVKLR